MASDVSQEIADLNDPPEDRDMRLERRIAALYADDPQFRAAEPNSTVIEAARRPGLRLAEILQTLAVGYGPGLRSANARGRLRQPRTPGAHRPACCRGSTPSATTTCGHRYGRSPQPGETTRTTR